MQSWCGLYSIDAQEVTITSFHSKNSFLLACYLSNFQADLSHNSLIPGPESIKDADAQWDWLESTLRSSTAHYLIVGGHYPVWSIAEHGPTKCLVDRLRPLLQKYHVTVYINGHDHNLQVNTFFRCISSFRMIFAIFKAFYDWPSYDPTLSRVLSDSPVRGRGCGTEDSVLSY